MDRAMPVTPKNRGSGTATTLPISEMDIVCVVAPGRSSSEKLRRYDPEKLPSAAVVMLTVAD